MRMHAQTAVIENGFVHIPETAPWLAEYLHELAVFPNGKHDDQADSPGLVQDAFRGPRHLRVLPPPARSGRAAPQAAARSNRIGDRLHGVGRRAGESAVNRGA
jgi:hypothetical protein